MNRTEFTRRVLTARDRMDAVQEAIARAWQKLDGPKNEESFETRLTRILIHACHDLQRAQCHVAPMEAAPEPSQGDSVNAPQRAATLALDEKLRLAVILHCIGASAR